MANDKQDDEKVRLAGWTAGATEQDKSTNPHRGKKNDDEALWDSAWEAGNVGEEFTAWGRRDGRLEPFRMGCGATDRSNVC